MDEIRDFSRSKGSSQFGLLTSEKIIELVNFEKELGVGHSMPEGLKKFLIKYNGGSFDECVFINGPMGPVVAAMFLPISSDENSSINKAFNYFQQEVADDVIPFASDPGGNYFLLGFKEENRNKVYFWDHARHKIYEISENFENFINSLVVDD